MCNTNVCDHADEKNKLFRENLRVNGYCDEEVTTRLYYILKRNYADEIWLIRQGYKLKSLFESIAFITVHDHIPM